jgi:hypothetical protein
MFYITHNNIRIITPTLIQSKSFIGRVPKSQSAETNVNLAIRPNKIISNMLVLIPVINENKWHVNCVCLFFPFEQRIQWHTVKIHRLFSHRFYWLKTDTGMSVFQLIQVYFLSKCPKFYSNTTGWTEIFNSCTDSIWYCIKTKFPSILCFVFPLISQHSYRYIVVQWYRHLAKRANRNSSYVRTNMSQHQTNCTLLCIISIYLQFFLQVDTWTHFVRTVLIRSLCVV